MSRDNKSSYSYLKTIRALILTLGLLAIYWLSQHIYKSVDHYNAEMTYLLINNQALTIVPAVTREYGSFEYAEMTYVGLMRLRNMNQKLKNDGKTVTEEIPEPERKFFDFKKSMEKVIANDDLWGEGEKRFPFEYNADFKGTDTYGEPAIISKAMVLTMDIKGQPINDLLCAAFRKERVKNPQRSLGCMTENGANTVWYDLRH